MTTLLHYGSFQRPDEKVPAKNEVDLVRALKAVHVQWMQVAKPKSHEYFTSMNQMDDSLAEAEHLIKSIASDLSRVSVNEVVKSIAADMLSGLFISALLTATDIPSMAAVFKQNYVGHRLPKGKIIVALPGSTIHSLAKLCEGNAINYGDAEYFAKQAISGVQINFRWATYFGDDTTGGIRLNYGQVASFDKHSGASIKLNSGLAPVSDSWSNPPGLAIAAIKEVIDGEVKKLKKFYTYGKTNGEIAEKTLAYDWQSLEILIEEEARRLREKLR